MMSTSILPNSRLRFGELRNIDDVEFWDLLELPEIPVQDDDVSYTVQSADRIDTIAYRFYGDSTLWWVVAIANDLELLPSQLNTGMVLRIPSPTYVSQRLFEQASS